VKMAAPGKPLSLVSITPTFTVNDAAAASAVLLDYLGTSKTEPRLSYCGWSATRTTQDSSSVGGIREAVGDSLCLRQCYPDGAVALSHIGLVRPCMEALLSGPLSLETTLVHGPAAEIAKCEAALADMNALFFESQCGVSFMDKEYGGVPRSMQHTSVHSRFTVSDWNAARPILDEFVAKTRAGEGDGCVYSGFDRCGDELFCREAFNSPSAIARHVESVGPCAEALLSGPATLVRTQIHGSLRNLQDYQEQMRQEGVYGQSKPEYFYKGSSAELGSDGGFMRFELQQSLKLTLFGLSLTL